MLQVCECNITVFRQVEKSLQNSEMAGFWHYLLFIESRFTTSQIELEFHKLPSTLSG